jgi:photosystem II stability/assembly factor-like uncharacterized protein
LKLQKLRYWGMTESCCFCLEGCMKKFHIVLHALWLAACTAVPSTQVVSTEAFPSPSVTSAIAMTHPFTPSPYVTLTPQLQPTLIIPTLSAGSPARLFSIQMIDAQTGWAIQEESREVLRPGSRTEYPWPVEGYILRTMDGGKTWQNVTPPTGAYSPGGFFALDANTAWASDNLTGRLDMPTTLVWRTTDGGSTWQPGQPFLIAETGTEFYWPARMQFIDRNIGWLLASVEVGMGNSLREVLFRTTDGGDTWERVNSFLEDLGGCGNGGLAFNDGTTGWYGSNCVGGGKLLIPFDTLFAEGGIRVRQTIDGGETFSTDTIIPTPPELQELAATNPEMMDCGEIRMITFAPEVLGIEWECINYTDWAKYRYFSLSTDTGQTWKTWKPTGNEYFLNAAHGWRLLSPGQLQQTTDGGLNWITLKTVGWESAQFDFINEQEGWAIVTSADSAAFVHTTDGGNMWEEIKPVITLE